MASVLLGGQDPPARYGKRKRRKRAAGRGSSTRPAAAQARRYPRPGRSPRSWRRRDWPEGTAHQEPGPPGCASRGARPGQVALAGAPVVRDGVLAPRRHWRSEPEGCGRGARQGCRAGASAGTRQPGLSEHLQQRDDQERPRRQAPVPYAERDYADVASATHAIAQILRQQAARSPDLDQEECPHCDAALDLVACSQCGVAAFVRTCEHDVFTRPIRIVEGQLYCRACRP